MNFLVSSRSRVGGFQSTGDFQHMIHNCEGSLYFALKKVYIKYVVYVRIFFIITSLIYLLFGFHKLFHFVRSTDVVVAPPFVYIDQVKNSLTDRIEISAQNSWVGKGGAFTGEIRFACS